PGNQRLAVEQLDFRNLLQWDGHAIDVEHRQTGKGLGRSHEFAIKLDHDVEAAFVLKDRADWFASKSGVDELDHVVNAHVIARAFRAVGNDHELRLRAFLFDAHISGPAAS